MQNKFHKITGKYLIGILMISSLSMLTGCGFKGCGKEDDKKETKDKTEYTSCWETNETKETTTLFSNDDFVTTAATYMNGEVCESFCATLDKGILTISQKETEGKIKYGDISGDIAVPWIIDRDKITKVIIKDKIVPKSVTGWFAKCTALTEVEGLDNIDLSHVTSISRMFQGDTSLKKIDLSVLDTKNIENVSYLLEGCTALEDANVSFSVESAKTAECMLSGCKNLKKLQIKGWDTSTFDNMVDIFYEVNPKIIPEWYFI